MWLLSLKIYDFNYFRKEKCQTQLGVWLMKEKKVNRYQMSLLWVFINNTCFLSSINAGVKYTKNTYSVSILFKILLVNQRFHIEFSVDSKLLMNLRKSIEIMQLIKEKQLWTLHSWVLVLLRIYYVGVEDHQGHITLIRYFNYFVKKRHGPDKSTWCDWDTI